MGHEGYAKISIAAAQALAGDEHADLAVFLPSPCEGGRLLYREAGAGLAQPDFERLRSSGIRHLYVRAEDVHRCETLLEIRLGNVIANPRLSPDEKAKLVHQVGTALAHDLTGDADAVQKLPENLHRTAQLIDAVIDCVLRDPLIAAHMLRMGAHERGTASHMFIVSALSVMLGAEVFGSDKRMLTDLGIAGMMHDIGKLGISPEIINKLGPLTSEELKLVHQHPIESVRLLGDDPHVTPAARQAILQHHEWVNGRGYPAGVCGFDLLAGSRIIAIADSFHAMIGRRAYRVAVTPVEATRAMNCQSGRQFDPDMLASWNALFQRCWLQSGGTPIQDLAVVVQDATGRHEHRANHCGQRDHRNRSKRHVCKRPIKVECVYAGRLHDATAAPDEFSTELRDISRSGVCLTSEHPMYRGETLHVCLRQRGGPCWVRSRVAWCRQHDAGGYRVGLRFIQRLSEIEVAQSVELSPLAVDDVAVAASVNRGFAGGETKSLSATASTVRTDDAVTRLSAIAGMRPVTLEAERTVVMLAASPDAQVRRKAIDVLAGIKTKTARATLLNAFRDPDPTVRERAIGAAGAMRMTEAAHLLRQLLKDPIDGVALRAAGALGRIGERDGFELAKHTLFENGPHTRLAAQVVGDIVGHRFAANIEGVTAARRYLANNPSLSAPV